MRKGLGLMVAIAFAVTALIVSSVGALAVSPHFVGASATLSGANLVVSWHEAGLGDDQLISYTASADATATFVCVNKGGANPSASNKTSVSGPVSASGTFSSGKNGNINQSLTLQPPAAPSTLSCPKGQTEQQAQVSYTNVTITDTTDRITEPVSGTFSACLLPNVRGAC